MSIVSKSGPFISSGKNASICFLVFAKFSLFLVICAQSQSKSNQIKWLKLQMPSSCKRSLKGSYLPCLSIPKCTAEGRKIPEEKKMIITKLLALTLYLNGGRNTYVKETLCEWRGYENKRQKIQIKSVAMQEELYKSVYLEILVVRHLFGIHCRFDLILKCKTFIENGLVFGSSNWIALNWSLPSVILNFGWQTFWIIFFVSSICFSSSWDKRQFQSFLVHINSQTRNFHWFGTYWWHGTIHWNIE